ncbi:MAG: fibronectin type III domain-containing protein [Gammaproteobacteria bacterium]|nr:fibronectin type III domain-containing protein [Gammaproteobacteria bacterium]
MSKTQHYFLPSVRQGLANAISEESTAAQRATVKVSLNLKARQKGTANFDDETLVQDVQLYGPGDILGFDSRIITRTLPTSDVGDFEPNYFPHIEFADADFIWRYSTFAANSEKGSLKPWLCLVVLVSEKLGDIDVEFSEGEQHEKNLPNYIVVENTNSLPNLDFSDRWAHVHITAGSDSYRPLTKEQLKNLLTENPERAVCRLLCARRLAPKVKYTAFLVPAFKTGVLAGLGESIPDGVNAQTLAWNSAQTNIRLPYYYRWDFRTGLRGDFEHLVRLLEPRELTEMGKRDIDCSNPGYGLKTESGIGRTVGLEGALQSLDTEFKPFVPDLDVEIEDVGVIFNIKIFQIANSKIRVSWQTSQPCYSLLRYGESDNYEYEKEDTSSERFQHQVIVDNLSADVSYHIQIVAKLDNAILSETEDQNFTLPYYDDFQNRLSDLLNQPNTEDLSERTVFLFSETNVIKNLAATFITLGDRAVIKWTTETPLGYRIEYGRDELSKYFDSSALNLTHEVILPNLVPGKQYLFKLSVQTEDKTIIDSTDGHFKMPPLPSVLPPVYGRWHQGKLKTPADGSCTKHIVNAENQDNWLDTLNLDPRHRMAAGMGAEVVRTHQEALMASAWEQLGEVEKVNDGLRRAQLGRDASSTLHRKIQNLNTEDALRVTSVAQKKIVAQFEDDEQNATQLTAKQYLQKYSRVQQATMDAAFRRISGPKNSILKRQARKIGKSVFELHRRVATQLTKGSLTPAGDVKRLIGAAHINDIHHLLTRELNTSVSSLFNLQTIDFTKEFFGNKFSAFGKNNEFDDTKSGFTGFLTEKQNNNASNGMYTVPASPTVVKQADTKDNPESFFSTFKNKLFSELNPEDVARDRIKSQIQNAEEMGERFNSIDDRDPLDPIMWAPEFPQPMYETLSDKSHASLLPGVEKIPQNSIGLLKTNRRFLESYLCGCNHEFANELLWRGFPTDQRGTYFRKFWDTSGFLPDSQQGADTDIKPITEWQENQLGENRAGVNNERLVLVIRGDLLKRYPNANIYAIEAVPKNCEEGDTVPAMQEYLECDAQKKNEILAGKKRILPIFSATLPPDLVVLGFPFDRETACGSEDSMGMYFIIEEQITDPRFGLDTPSKINGKLSQWSDLSWSHFGFGVDKSDFHYGAFLDAPPNTNNIQENLKTEWDEASSAKRTWITWQKPARIAIHAKQIIPLGVQE